MIIWAVLRIIFNSITGIFIVLAAGIVIIFIISNSIKPEGDREVRSREAVEIVEDVGFKSAAVTGEPKEDAGKIIEQPVAVLVGKERGDPNTPRAKECWATVTVTWTPEGAVTLTLKSLTGVIQQNTANEKALLLPEYAGCGEH